MHIEFNFGICVVVLLSFIQKNKTNFFSLKIYCLFLEMISKFKSRAGDFLMVMLGNPFWNYYHVIGWWWNLYTLSLYIIIIHHHQSMLKILNIMHTLNIFILLYLFIKRNLFYLLRVFILFCTLVKFIKFIMLLLVKILL